MESFLVKDAEALVQEYLADDRVLLKNKGYITFNTSISVQIGISMFSQYFIRLVCIILSVLTFNDIYS